MSRKTRREKIAAEQNRKQQLVNAIHYSPSFLGTVPVSISDTNASSVKNSKYSFNLNTTPTSHPAINTSDYLYVLNDLRRIFVLAALAFCAQVVLWYLLENRMLG